MRGLLNWLKVWSDIKCPMCMKAMKAIKEQKAGETLELRLTIIKDANICSLVHIERIEEG